MNANIYYLHFSGGRDAPQPIFIKAKVLMDSMEPFPLFKISVFSAHH